MTFLGRLSFEQIEFAFQFPWFELRNTQKRKVAMETDLFKKKSSVCYEYFEISKKKKSPVIVEESQMKLKVW